MFTGFDFDVIERSLPYLFKEGMTFTLTLTAMAMTGGIVFGTLLAMMRLSSYRFLNVPAAAYVNLMRSVPLVLVIFWFYFLVPWMGGWIIGANQPIQVGAFWSSVITFTLFEAAYYAEIMRAGIQSVARGQVSAGQALGLNYWQTMGYVVLPQAFRNMLPVLLTQTIILFQDTSLVYAIGAYDLLKGFEVAGKNFNRPVETYLVAAVVYFVICFSLSMLVRRLQQKIQIIR
jgi:glutamate/aspartate transport system permease protein